MTRRASHSPGLLGLLVIWLAGSSTLSAQGMGPVNIVLLSEAVVDDSLVTLEQIARLNGGPEALRKRLGRLDVAEFKLGAAQTTVLSDHVRFRLLLAGVQT